MYNIFPSFLKQWGGGGLKWGCSRSWDVKTVLISDLCFVTEVKLCNYLHTYWQVRYCAFYTTNDKQQQLAAAAVYLMWHSDLFDACDGDDDKLQRVCWLVKPSLCLYIFPLNRRLLSPCFNHSMFNDSFAFFPELVWSCNACISPKFVCKMLQCFKSLLTPIVPFQTMCPNKEICVLHAYFLIRILSAPNNSAFPLPKINNASKSVVFNKNEFIWVFLGLQMV